MIDLGDICYQSY